VADTVDPLAGSYYIESLTNSLEKKIEEYIEEVDLQGGAVKAIENGYIQRQINQSSYRYQEEIENEERILVGVNKYQIEEEPLSEIYRVDPAMRQLQVARLESLRQRRDSIRANEALQRLESAAKGNEKLMPRILEAVKAYATLGEICDSLRSVFGSYKASKDF